MERDIASIKQKSLTGIVALTSRTFLLQLIAFCATLLLTIFLSPSIFGIFYVVSALIAFLGYFSDVGLAAALIQKKEDLTPDDLKTTFTIQQILVGVVVVTALIFSGNIAEFYKLDSDGLWLFRALIISFFLSSLKTIPSVLLERKLDFHKLVLPQLAETIGFYAIAVLLAWKGYGVMSFTVGVLVRGILGLIVIYVLQPWDISLGLSGNVARRLLGYGIPFQLNSFLALIKDDLLTIFLGKILPFTHVGYIGWAKKWAEVPLRLIMDSVIRVTFPAFSRIQHEKQVLANAIEKTLFGLSLTIFPITALLLFSVRPLVLLIPSYGKWIPALDSFYLFAIGAAIASLSTPLTNALNAVGKITTTLKLMVLWTILTWILTIVFVRFIGFNGVSLSLLLVSTTIILVVRLLQAVTRFSFSRSIRIPFFAVLLQIAWYGISIDIVPGTAIHLAIRGLLGVILYAAIVWVFEKDRIRLLRRQFSALPLWNG